VKNAVRSDDTWFFNCQVGRIVLGFVLSHPSTKRRSMDGHMPRQMPWLTLESMLNRAMPTHNLSSNTMDKPCSLTLASLYPPTQLHKAGNRI